MFAVKGWSVSADKLKSETGSASTPKSTGASTVADSPAAAPKKSKKRKRQAEDVTSSNVADLWEKVIEHKEPQPQNDNGKAQSQSRSKKDKKRQKLNAEDAKAKEQKITPEEAAAKETTGQDATPVKSEGKVSKKDKKKTKRDGQQPKVTNNDAASPKESKSTSKAVLPAIPPAPPKLTPLQASMREKLISARFRHLNETLYTRPSREALSLFADAPEMFTEYHEGFRRQVEVWPENPVEGYLADIRARAKARFPRKDDRSKKGQAAAQQQQQQPMPDNKSDNQPLPRNRTTNICTIADLGCGDARLASELAKEKSKLRVEILSFDLHSPHPLVTRADIANLPLANGAVDVAIFCLALMGTNWIDFIEEAYRVLRWKGELWVAEIKSRFAGATKNGKVVEHSVGHRRKQQPGASAKKGAAAKEVAAAGDETTLLVEVDGAEDTRQQTDVSAFVDVLNKRGFMLVGQDQGHGADSIDLSNKMFVKMRFMKSAPAVKGKCVRKEDEEKEQRNRLGGKMPGMMPKKLKFLEGGDDVNEAGVLKPCVYKLR